jgi:hypothetical protein
MIGFACSFTGRQGDLQFALVEDICGRENRKKLGHDKEINKRRK